MKKVNHIGIAVSELDAAIATYQALGFTLDKTEEVPAQKVDTAFFNVGGSHIELLAPTSGDSPISKFLGTRGPGIHHICIEVENIEATLAQMKQNGIRLINQEPVIGAGGHRVAFVHPKSANGVLLEVMEAV